MNLEAIIKNPICIKLGKNSNIVMASDSTRKEYPLSPGVMFGCEHYGFVIITENNGKEKEYIYPTQCKLQAVGIERNNLKIFEEGKNLPWLFDKIGNLEHSTFNDFSDEMKSDVALVADNFDMFMGEPIIKNPIKIKIDIDPEKSMIMQNGDIKENLPLHPGVMLGSEHYGFILIIDTKKGQKEVVYPTQNRIDAIGVEYNYANDIKVYEKGKYTPWIFDNKGEFKQSASYNKYAKMDKNYIGDCLRLNQEDSQDNFTLKKKK